MSAVVSCHCVRMHPRAFGAMLMTTFAVVLSVGTILEVRSMQGYRKAIGGESDEAEGGREGDEAEGGREGDEAEGGREDDEAEGGQEVRYSGSLPRQEKRSTQSETRLFDTRVADAVANGIRL